MKIFILLASLASAALAVDFCGGTYRGFQYTITSPNYPGDYPGNRNCVYYFQGDASATCQQEFHLQFLDFSVRATENCKGDYLQVGDRNIFCGNVVGLRRFTGKNNTLTVIFHSDEKDADKGFKILVTALPCTLKFNNFKNHSYKGLTDESGTRLRVNDITNGAYHRGIRGSDDANNTITRSTFTPNDNTSSDTSPSSGTTSSPQIDPILKDNTITTSHPSGIGTSQDNLRVTSYLFLPPGENSLIKENTHFNEVSPPPKELLPPSQNSVSSFTKLQFPVTQQNTVAHEKSSLGHVQKLTVPARNYGEPGAIDYDTSDCDGNRPIVQQSDGSLGSSERINYDPLQGQGFSGTGLGFGNSPNFVYDPRYGFVGSNGYPQSGYNPGNYYPNGYPNNNPSIGYPEGGYNPSINYPNGVYNPPNGYPEGGYNPNLGSPSYPNGGYNPGYNINYNPVSPNYYPGYNPITPNYNPGFVPNNNPYIPSVGGNYYPNAWGNGFNGLGGECCRVQSSQRFTLVSPGFPGSISSNGYSCRYTITKSSPDVCRLRLNFRFFNFGTEDPYCSYGHIEIDGRRYCGCKTGQSVQVLFADYIAKSISVTFAGYPRNKFAGFLIDVIQESCRFSGSYPQYPSYPSYPSYPYDPNNAGYPGYPGYPGYSGSPGYSGYPGYLQRRNDVFNSTLGEQTLLRTQNASIIFPSPKDPNPHIRSKRDLGYSYPKPVVAFPHKDVQLIPALVGKKTHEKFFIGSCQNRIFLDWAIASKEAILRNLRCGGFGIPGSISRKGYLPPKTNNVVNAATTACEEINVSQGVIKSPSYPNSYPHNVKRCYRFNKAPNFCKLELYLRNFEIKRSQRCFKDYLSFSTENTKFCGRSLNDFRTMFDLTRTNSVEVYFVSDSHGTGRGFKIGFSQLPCEVSANF